jgi:hypothetical protein
MKAMVWEKKPRAKFEYIEIPGRHARRPRNGARR